MKALHYCIVCKEEPCSPTCDATCDGPQHHRVALRQDPDGRWLCVVCGDGYFAAVGAERHDQHIRNAMEDSTYSLPMLKHEAESAAKVAYGLLVNGDQAPKGGKAKVISWQIQVWNEGVRLLVEYDCPHWIGSMQRKTSVLL